LDSELDKECASRESTEALGQDPKRDPATDRKSEDDDRQPSSKSLGEPARKNASSDRSTVPDNSGDSGSVWGETFAGFHLKLHDKLRDVN
jgi:hypothetical protein